MDYPKRYDKDGFPDDDGCYADAYETTDEITRLTAENAELRSGIVTTETLCFSHEGRIENLMKENAALRKKDGYIEDLEGTIQQCPECGSDSMERQFVCEHCGHRAAIDDAEEK